MVFRSVILRIRVSIMVAFASLLLYLPLKISWCIITVALKLFVVRGLMPNLLWLRNIERSQWTGNVMGWTMRFFCTPVTRPRCFDCPQSPLPSVDKVVMKMWRDARNQLTDTRDLRTIGGAQTKERGYFRKLPSYMPDNVPSPIVYRDCIYFRERWRRRQPIKRWCLVSVGHFYAFH